VRLRSLDAFRGLTIALMILVDMAGAAEQFYIQLDHAEWAGWTLTDLVFPFFLFALGFSIAASKLDERPREGVHARILKRAALLFLLGVLGNRLMADGWADTRVMGVLQRIALCYLGAALAALHLPLRAQYALAGFILLGYWAALELVPVPGFGAGFLTRTGSLASYVDRLVISRPHLYPYDGWVGAGDPEGLLSTLPALCNALLGLWTGLYVRGRPVGTDTSRLLLVSGAVLAVLGALWGLELPVIKKLWTSSYALLMGGACLLAYGGLYALIEVRGRGLAAMETLGRNALTAFLGSVMLLGILEAASIGGENVLRWTVARLYEPWLSPKNASAAFALTAVAFWCLLVAALDRKGWRLKA
jgi:predicted acyltransferase